MATNFLNCALALIILTYGNLSGRHGGLMVSRCAQLQSERSGFKPWPGTLCCVLGQDTLLSQCLSPPRFINGYRRT